MKYTAVDRALLIVELTRKLGRVSVKMLGQRPGWTKSTASRHLAALAERGWLERLSDGKGNPLYVLGPKVLALDVDLKL